MRPGEQSRNQMRIARPPDQVRPQRDGRQVRAVCRQHRRSAIAFVSRIVRVEMRRVRQRLVAAFDVAAGVDDARRAGVDELADAVPVGRRR